MDGVAFELLENAMRMNGVTFDLCPIAFVMQAVTFVMRRVTLVMLVDAFKSGGLAIEGAEIAAYR